MIMIQVVGPGCRHCKALLTNVNTALARNQIEATVNYVTDMEAIANSGVMRTPGLMINGVIVSQGKVHAPIEIDNMIRNASIK